MEDDSPATPHPGGPGTVGARELAAEEVPEAVGEPTGLSGKIYSLLTWAAWPAVGAHLLRRRYRGRETSVSMYERCSFSTKPRPSGHVIWFHAVSIGESAVALPVVHRCLAEYPSATILLTTSTVEAYSLLSHAIPSEESELWPNLICRAHAHGVRLALLNARMSSKSFLKWHNWTLARTLAGSVLSRFSLIIPQSDLDVGRFRLLGAQLWQMPGWCADLKYAAAMGACVWRMWRPNARRVEQLRRAVAERECWVAASTHEKEEVAAGRVHKGLRKLLPTLLTVVVPRHPWRCTAIREELTELGLAVQMWSACDLEDIELMNHTEVLVVDVVGELPLLFTVAELAFIGGSLFEGSRGHNLAEAAVAGCSVLVGPHAGHFTQMAEELNVAAREESLDLMARQQSASVPSSPIGSGTLRSPMRRFASPTVARSLHRRRDEALTTTGDSPAGGLSTLEDELAGRRDRRRTHMGGTPGRAWFHSSSNSDNGSLSTPASGAGGRRQQIDSHQPTPDRSDVGTSSYHGTPGSRGDRIASRLAQSSSAGSASRTPGIPLAVPNHGTLQGPTPANVFSLSSPQPFETAENGR